LGRKLSQFFGRPEKTKVFFREKYLREIFCGQKMALFLPQGKFKTTQEDYFLTSNIITANILSAKNFSLTVRKVP
jgi:hypothetical protein